MDMDPQRVRPLAETPGGADSRLFVDADGNLFVVAVRQALTIHPGETTLVPGVPQAIVTESLASGLRVHGFHATAHRYTRFNFLVAGTTLLSAYVTSDAPLAYVALPTPLLLDAQTTVAVQGECLSEQGSTDAQAALLVSP